MVSINETHEINRTMQMDVDCLQQGTYDVAIENILEKTSNVREQRIRCNNTHLKGTKIHYYDDDDCVIGSGATCYVYMGFFDTKDKPAAIKRVSSEHYEISKNELQAWKDLSYPSSHEDGINIVQLFDWVEWDVLNHPNPVVYFAMELASLNLEQYILQVKQMLIALIQNIVTSASFQNNQFYGENFLTRAEVIEEELTKYFLEKYYLRGELHSELISDFNEELVQANKHVYDSVAHTLKKTNLTEVISRHRKQLIAHLFDAGKGLKWLHSNGYIHRDVKPQNILICVRGGTEKKLIAKLTDFGISRKMKGTSTDSTGKGTSDWMSPEAIKAMHHPTNNTFRNTRSIDIFSFGVTCHFAMSWGVHPFLCSERNGRNIAANIEHLDILPRSLVGKKGIVANHLFEWMMNKNPDKRPNIDEVLAHPFFWDDTKCISDFVVRVGLTLCYNKNAKSLRERLDQNYVLRNSAFDWGKIVGSQIASYMQHRRSPNSNNKRRKKEYDFKSVTSLVEVIRDKHSHYTEIVDELLSEECFGEQCGDSLVFSKERFSAFFMEHFPDLTIFLYTELCGSLLEFSELKSLKIEYDLSSSIPLLP